LNTRDIVYVSLFAAIVAALGLLPKIQLMSGVPITAQSLGVMLAGGVLGARRGGLALLLFVILVLAGLPLLAGGRGGLGLLASPSGGFLLAFPVAAFVTGFMVERFWHKITLPIMIVANIVGGIVVLYCIGIPWLAIAGGFTASKAAMLSAPFLPGDLIKAVLAAIAAMAVKRGYPLIDSARLDVARPDVVRSDENVADVTASNAISVEPTRSTRSSPAVSSADSVK